MSGVHENETPEQARERSKAFTDECARQYERLYGAPTKGKVSEPPLSDSADKASTTIAVLVDALRSCGTLTPAQQLAFDAGKDFLSEPDSKEGGATLDDWTVAKIGRVKSVKRSSAKEEG